MENTNVKNLTHEQIELLKQQYAQDRADMPRLQEKFNASMTDRERIIFNLINDGGKFTSAKIIAEVSEDMTKRIVNEDGTYKREPSTFETLKNGKVREIKGKVIVSPFADDVVTKIVMCVVGLNGNYTNQVNNQLDREGKEAEFQAQQNWHKPVYDSFNGSIYTDRKTETKLYLKMSLLEGEANNQNLGYLVNGKEATAEQTELIKLWKKPYVAPTNQGTEKPINIRLFKLQGIKAIKCGETVIFE